ncbi:MAG TPA: thiamine pyrophosphate-dependent enzyme [bacterium]|nr:thiamine pyrophosphate-dependent enzyme [bacterium]
MEQKLDYNVMHKGHVACPGCGAVLAMRYVMNILGEKTVIVLPACCWSVITGRYPTCSVKVPLFHTAFETAACTASGVRAALDIKGDTQTQVLAWAGDGGTFDIGLQALSGAAERNDNIIYVCYDNEAYMNTGIQRSSATPYGAWTTTTPVEHYKNQQKKNIMEIMAAHRIPYAATASIAYPEDLMEKVARAKNTFGMKFLHILCPCPTGWKYSSDLTVELARNAVRCRAFPLYEIMDGEKYRLTHEPEDIMAVRDYIKPQRRFAHLQESEIQSISQRVDTDWKRLMHTIESWPA